MCHAVPVLLLARNGDVGLGECDGLKLDVNLALVPEAQPGDQLIVHVGVALALLSQSESADLIRLREEFLAHGKLP